MRICVINGEPIVTTTVGEFLRDLEHDVACFHSVDELLKVRVPIEATYDVILVELCKPAEAARRVLARVHERYPAASIIVLTANGVTFSPQEAVACGIHAYLRKPVSLTELELMLLRLPRSSNGGPAE